MALAPIEIFGFQLAARDGSPGFIHLGAAHGRADLAAWEEHLVLLAHGGRGSGKTWGGAIRTALYCRTWRGALFIVTAPTMWMMHDSTWPALEATFDSVGLKPGRGGYTYNRDREEVTIHPTGVTILLRSTEHPDRLRGQSAAAAWMDEPRDSPFEAFTNLTGTLRQDGYPHQLWLTTTPAGRRHWLCKIFYPNRAIYMPHERIITPTAPMAGGSAVGAGAGRYVPFPARTRDNPFGGEGLYQFMSGTMGTGTLLARQELEGEFVLMEGLVYDQWDPDFYVKPRAEWPTQVPRRVIAGVDFGFTNPSAFCIEGLDEQGRRYIMHELYERHLSEQQLVSRAIDIANEYHPYRWECVASETPIETPTGPRTAAAIQPGDSVITRHGTGVVTRTQMAVRDDLRHVVFGDGRVLDATPEHPIWIVGTGWCKVSLVEQRLHRGETLCTLAMTQSGHIGPELSGPSLWVRFQRGGKSTIRIAIEQISRWKIWSALVLRHTRGCTPTTTPCAQDEMDLPGHHLHAWDAEQPVRGTPSPRSSVVLTAATPTIGASAMERKIGLASSAVTHSPFAATHQQELVPLRVVTILSLVGKHCVHDLAVESEHEFFANGVLTHNCDSEDPRWIEAMRNAGLPAVRARKTKGSTRDISSGLGRCYAALGRPEIGPQRFFVDPDKCPNFQNEIEGFVYDVSTTMSVKQTNPAERGLLFANHLMDAWRYDEGGIAYYWPEILGPDGAPIYPATRLLADFGE